jgi:predicted Co/Zn/Cd cation transporter (cation efflux family)
MNNSSNFETAKVLATSFIVLIALGVFILFNVNSDSILEGDGFYSLITLIIIVFALLIGLFYLVSNSKHQSVRVHKASVKKHKKARSRR